MKVAKSLVNSLLLPILLIIIFGNIITAGPRGANDYPFTYSDNVREGFNLPMIWTDRFQGLGEYSVSSLWSWPIDVLYGLGGSIGVDFSILERVIGILAPVILGYFAITKLLTYYKVSKWGQVVGSLFFLSNNYFLLLIDGGQPSLALAYSALPLAFLTYKKAIETGNLKEKLYFIFALLVLSIADIRIVYFLSILILFDFLFQFFLSKTAKQQILTRYFTTGVIGVLALVGVHFYWILPSILVRAPSLPAGYSNQSQISFLSFANLGDAILFQSPHWYKNIFGSLNHLQPEFFLIPILVILAILKPKNLAISYWLLIGLIGVFLAKGSSEPFSFVYPWLFTHLPGFSLFRDPVKFYILVGLSYSILISIAVDNLSQKIVLKVKNKEINLVPILAIIYLVFLARPVYLGKMTGLLFQANFISEYQSLGNAIASDSTFGRIFWLPSKPPLGYSSPSHLSINAIDQIAKRPFAIGIVGTYETLNFLRQASFMGEIFDVTAIADIAYPYPDRSRQNLSPDDIRYYYTFLHQLTNLPWISRLDPNSKVPLLKTKNHQDLFFVSPNLWWVIGSDDIYNQATKSAQLKLAKNAMVFPEEKSGLGDRINEFPKAKIVLNKKTDLDLAASFLKSNELVFPAQSLDDQPNQSGWWKRGSMDLVDFRNFLQTKYGIDDQDFDLGGGWAIAEKNLSLNINDKKVVKDRVLLARVMESSRSGQLSFYQDNHLIGKVKTKSSNNNIRWFEIGTVFKNNQPIIIKSEGDINIVNALALVNPQNLASYENIVAKFKAEKRIVKFQSDSSKQILTNVTFKQINSTEYEVSISGLKEPAYLVFSQSYDPLWRLNNQQPIPVYSLLNAFMIDKNGRFQVEFEAQKYVYIGLIVSLATFVGIILLFLLSKPKN